MIIQNFERTQHSRQAAQKRIRIIQDWNISLV